MWVNIDTFSELYAFLGNYFLNWAKFEGLGVNEQFLIEDLINSGYMYNQKTGVFYNALKKIGLRITKNGGMFEVEVYI